MSPICILINLELKQITYVTFQRGDFVSCYSGLVFHGERDRDSQIITTLRKVPHTLVETLVCKVHFYRVDENIGCHVSPFSAPSWSHN